MSTELRLALERVAGRFRRVRLWGGLALCWSAWALAGLALAATLARPGRGVAPIGWVLAAFLASAAVTAAASASLAARAARDRRWVARRIEARHPTLGTALLAAVEEDARAEETGRLGFLQHALIRDALAHRRRHDWDETVPSRTLLGVRLAHAVSLGLFLAATAALLVQSRARAHIDGRGVQGLRVGGAGVTIEPGDVEIERGTSLLVVARFPADAPADARLVVGEGPLASRPLAMARALDDPTFAARLESVPGNLSYHVEYEGRRTPSYRVRVFEYPELRRTDARMVYPAYTALAPKAVEDIRHVTAVEGTALALRFRLNKEVASALLIDEKGKATALTPEETQGEGGEVAYKAALTLADTHRYRVQLVDRQGRANRVPADLVVNVTRNRPPVVKMTRPGHDVRVSPVEELALKADLEDDFGLVRHGLSYTLAGREPREVVLANPSGPAPKRLTAEHMLDFESFRAAPDELVTYLVWAEDIGPDGRPRRTSGDLYFAEVRHFEEIFRQGQNAPGGSAEEEESQQGGNAQESDRLAELQKSIINGTWTLIRRLADAPKAAAIEADGRLLRDSQRKAIEQAGPMAERLRDPESKASLGRATHAMKEAEGLLDRTAKSAAIAEARQALAAEQVAYQALLKLRAREFQVTRNNSRSRQRGQAAGAGPSQRQLQQLELSAEENRYETQRAARAPQDARSKQEQAQRETNQVLNRLRELARRQTDLNDRLKELQSALEAAKTEEARAEARRQLKRLREQQQQVLRDTDELQERMERDENRERMAAARTQIEQGREHLRQASEALEQGRVPQAVTEGARAGRQLEDLREQVRKQASNQFTQEMTELRGQARRLDDDQKRLNEQLDRQVQQPRRGLRDDADREPVRKGLEQQRERLGQLVDRIERTVQEAEETEPLLAKGLFDAVTETNKRRAPDALQAAEQLVEAGIPAEAARASRHAGEGIERLRAGVERAAEGVLGDEAAALRRAQGELDELDGQVRREIARATGRNPAEAPERPASPRPPTGTERPKAANPSAPRDQARSPQASRQPGARQPGSGDRPTPDPDPQGPGTPGEGQAPQDNPPGEANPPGQGNPPGQTKGGNRANPQGGRPGLRGGGNPTEKGQRPQGEGQQAGADPPSGPPQGGGGGGGGGNAGGNPRRAEIANVIEGLSGGPGGPITGAGFREWSDRIREVEEILEDPELRAEAARIRDRARGAREEFKRHAKAPDWKELQRLVADPLRELRNKVADEVRRRESPDALVPIDRDPVPNQFAEGVRRYYERLGSGR